VLLLDEVALGVGIGEDCLRRHRPSRAGGIVLLLDRIGILGRQDSFRLERGSATGVVALDDPS
jgi:hypothetical protein